MYFVEINGLSEIQAKMSHRGRSGRGRDNFNWSTTSNKAFRPRGLRGRDIGLYYRDQHIRGKKFPKEDIIVSIILGSK